VKRSSYWSKLAVFFYKVHEKCPGFQKTALQQNIDEQTIDDDEEK